MNSFPTFGKGNSWEKQAQVKLAPAKQRAREMIEEFARLAQEENDVATIRNCLLTAIREAETSIRVRDPSDVLRGWTYETVADHPTRITAARILAELGGWLSGKDVLNVSVEHNSVSVTVDQRVTELVELGIPREELLRELEQVITDARAAQPAAGNARQSNLAPAVLELEA